MKGQLKRIKDDQYEYKVRYKDWNGTGRNMDTYEIGRMSGFWYIGHYAGKHYDGKYIDSEGYEGFSPGGSFGTFDYGNKKKNSFKALDNVTAYIDRYFVP